MELEESARKQFVILRRRFGIKVCYGEVGGFGRARFMAADYCLNGLAATESLALEERNGFISCRSGLNRGSFEG